MADDSSSTRGPGQPADDDALTSRQRRILDYLDTYTARNGYPPTMREIGQGVELASTSSVAHQLRRLTDLGWIEKDPHRPRAYRLVTGDRTAPAADVEVPEEVTVPVVGRIAAGGPVLAEQDLQDRFTLPRRLVGDGDVFALEVRGQSMTDAAICDGDWVAVRRQPVAENGDIVAAMIDGEATVKRLKHETGHTWLMPANPAYQPIPGNRATILGKVVAVLRHL
jgi:repressor LexA